MSSKDNKPDLSNLKSRLGLKKSGDDSEPSSEKTKQPKSTGSGGQTALKGSKKRPGAKKKKGSGGVDDRLAALKQSKLKSSKKGEPEQPSQPQQPTSAGAGQPKGRGAADRGGRGDEFAAATESNASGVPGQQQSGSAAGQKSGARRQAGPPPGAQGPPPTAMSPPPTQRQSTASATSRPQTASEDDEDIDLKDFDLDDGGIFSPATIVVLVCVLVLGLMFGYFASSSLDARAIQQSRVEDARSLQGDLEPRVEDFERAREIIEQLADDDITEVDIEAARELAELDFVVTSRVLPRQRMLLADQSIVGRLNHVMAHTDALYRLVLEHHRVTTGADRDELEAYIEGIDEFSTGDDEEIALTFSIDGWITHSIRADSDEDEHADVTHLQFNPSPGHLVRVPVRPDFDPEEEAEADEPRSRFEVDEEGNIDVEYAIPGQYGENGGTQTMSIYDLVPLDERGLLHVDRNNAVQRYHHRIGQMQEYADAIARVMDPLQDEIDQVASEDVPLFSIGTTVDDPADHDDNGPVADDLDGEAGDVQEEAEE